MTFLRRKPWILIVVLIATFLSAWAIFLTIAIRNKPETIEPAKPASRLKSTTP